MKNKLSIFMASLAACAMVLLSPAMSKITWAGSDFMVLTTTAYETGISYRAVQSHAPIGLITNPCSYADNFAVAIDWNDGSGEHKPDTNVETKPFYTKVPVVQNGVYLFWDDTHVPAEPGAQTAITKLTVHCLGDPPGDHLYVTRNLINVYARIPVNSAEFTKDGKPVDSAKGHDTVDLTITLDAPAPPSGTWVKLGTNPPGALNSLPAFFQVPARQTQATISDMELRNPSRDTTLTVIASTVGRPQQSQQLIIHP